ncbi:surface lipoprotein assembly modifier [Roseivivax marinus]|uniref:surface lipoprotein assembly modifier n=1 Tax=Roseivivax marinus TaxID=1379903 RepID=UPI001F03AFCB|nr:surface lipoprotein assembly modifier [Roseivivax marinus]UMA65293.1 surface lipoprotein assembly modifier [Roseivivax marinus]
MIDRRAPSRRRPIRRAALGAAFAVLATLSAPGGAMAQEASGLSAGQMRQLAAADLDAGRPAAARQVARALIDRDPTDVQALLVLSRAERDLQDFDAARDAGLGAWRQAGTDDERFAAALAVAQALSSEGARTRAQLWLRRAMQVAPTKRQKALAVRDFRYVRLRNPWSTRLSFSVAPSSNVNGGSRRDTVDLYLEDTPIGDVPVEAALGGASKALSGIEYSMGLATSYRLHQTERSRLSVDLLLDHTTYTLSDDAKDIAPEAEGADFAVSRAALGLTQDWTAPSSRLGLRYGASIMRTDYGGEPLVRTLAAHGTLRYALTPKVMGQLTARRTWDAGYDTRADATGWQLAAGLATSIGANNTLSLRGRWQDVTSDSGALDYVERAVDAGLGLGTPILGTDVSFNLTAAQRKHDDHPYSAHGREDTRLSASATLTLQQIDYYGFVPDITFEASRTESSLGLYDSEEFGISLGIRSRF